MMQVGFVVMALKNGKPVQVSGNFETRGGAEDYQKLYLKSYPGSGAFIKQNAATEQTS